MDLSQILPIQSTGVRAALALSSVLLRSLVEADEVRKEEEARMPGPGKVFEETCAQSGIPIPDLDAVLLNFMGGGAEASAKLADLRTLAMQSPDLGAFLQSFAVRLATQPAEPGPPTAPPPTPPSPPPSPPPSASAAPTPRPSVDPKAAKAPVFRPDFAPEGTSEAAVTARAVFERLGQLEDTVTRLQKDHTSLRAHVHTELSTARLLERIERLHDALGPATGRTP